LSVGRSAAIHDRVCEAILDAAAGLLVEGGEPSSMSDVAKAAGLSRATLYRYFPTREQLLQALRVTAVEVFSTRLAGADLDAVPVAEGVARVARVVAAVGSEYAVLVGRPRPAHSGEDDQRFKAPILALLRRGIEDGTFRPELSIDELTYLFGSLLQTAAQMAVQDLAGVEKAAALVTSVFLHGTQRRKETAP
jgi:AcrR family transcriptional regulator